MVCDANSIGDDGERWVYRAAGREEAGVDNIEVIEVVGFAVNVKDGLFRVGAEAAGTVLVAYAF